LAKANTGGDEKTDAEYASNYCADDYGVGFSFRSACIERQYLETRPIQVARTVTSRLHWLEKVDPNGDVGIDPIGAKRRRSDPIGLPFIAYNGFNIRWLTEPYKRRTRISNYRMAFLACHSIDIMVE
jgi:hypothetical protein